jgi:hypothetical protein
LKTTNIPLLGDCPRWDEDIPKDRAAEFRAILSGVQQLILTVAAQRLIILDDVLGWHETLFEAFVPLDCYAGNFRGDSHPCLSVNVQVGGVLGSTWQVTDIHMRQLAAHVRRDLIDLELNWTMLTPQDRTLRLAINIANLVGGFIRIHPFVNGNGRLSRLLWRWSLYRFGVPPQVPVHPRPNPPYPAIMAAAMQGDLRPFVQHVLQHLASHRPDAN